MNLQSANAAISAFAIAALATLALTLPSSAAAAVAATIVSTDGIGVSSRSAPQIGAKNGYGAPEGATVVIECHVWGDAVGPRNNRLWDYVSYAGRKFYVSDFYTSSPTIANVPIPGVPFCGASPAAPSTPPTSAGDSRPDRAASWAVAHKSRVWASSADYNLLNANGGNRGWAPGPVGEWSGDCMRFAAAAWYSVGVVPFRGGTAKAVGDSYRRARRLRSGVPPRGTIVFYSWGSAGHAGISLGGGQVVSTRGVDGDRLPVRQHAYNGIGLAYRGWADPR